MNALILEDDQVKIKQFKQRMLEKGWVGTFVETANDAIKQLSDHTFDIIFLDHDLGDEVYVSSDHKNTGAEVARWLSTNPISAQIIIHSLNPFGSKYMKDMIEGSYVIPFIWKENKFHEVIVDD